MKPVDKELHSYMETLSSGQIHLKDELKFKFCLLNQYGTKVRIKAATKLPGRHQQTHVVCSCHLMEINLQSFPDLIFRWTLDPWTWCCLISASEMPNQATQFEDSCRLVIIINLCPQNREWDENDILFYHPRQLKPIVSWSGPYNRTFLMPRVCWLVIFPYDFSSEYIFFKDILF